MPKIPHQITFYHIINNKHIQHQNNLQNLATDSENKEENAPCKIKQKLESE